MHGSKNCLGANIRHLGQPGKAGTAITQSFYRYLADATGVGPDRDWFVTGRPLTPLLSVRASVGRPPDAEGLPKDSRTSPEPVPKDCRSTSEEHPNSFRITSGNWQRLMQID